MAETSTDALTILKGKFQVSAPLVVVFGADVYLQREVLRTIRRQVGSASGDAVASKSFETGTAALQDVLDELCAVSLFGEEVRLVIVEDADTFVTANRPGLERYVQRPAKNSMLVLVTKSWPGNTRLAKSLAGGAGLAIRCDPPKLPQLRSWLVNRSKELAVELDRAALDVLLEIAPSELGILDQELQKLVNHVGRNGNITPQTVHEIVGGGKVRQTWDMIDAAARGDAAEALSQLDRLLTAGEDPLGVLPQMAGVLRRYVIAGRAVEAAEHAAERPNLRSALLSAGIPSFKLQEAERQLRQLGRKRVGRLMTWLLEADLELKGVRSRGDPARRVLETMIVRLSKAADERVHA